MSTMTQPGRVVAHCRHCGGRIVWTLTARGKRMPVNVRPDAEAGTVSLTRDPSGIYATVLGHAAAAEARSAGRRLHVPHAATCQGT